MAPNVNTQPVGQSWPIFVACSFVILCWMTSLLVIKHGGLRPHILFAFAAVDYNYVRVTVIFDEAAIQG